MILSFTITNDFSQGLSPPNVEAVGCRSEWNDGALGRGSTPISADQSGEDRREHGGPEDRIMVHVIRNELTVAHANKRIRHSEADRTRDEVRGDTVPAQKGCRSPGAVADVVQG